MVKLSNSDPQRPLLNLLDKINFKKVIKMLLYQTLFYTTFITHGET